MRNEKEVQELKGAAYTAMKALREKAASEKRSMTDDETMQWDRAYAEYQSYEKEIEMIQKEVFMSAQDSSERELPLFEMAATKDGEKKRLNEYHRFFENLFDLSKRSTITQAEAMKMAKSETPTRATQGTGTTGGQTGGYVIPEEFVRMLEVYMKQFGGMMQACYQHRSRRGGTMRLPTVNDITSTGAWVEDPRSSGIAGRIFTFDRVLFSAFTWVDVVKLDWEFIQDEDVDFVAKYLAQLIGEACGRAVNTAFTTGDGTGKPTGLLTTATTGKTAASSSAFTKSEMIDLKHSVNAAYRTNAAWMMNDLTLAEIVKLDQTTNVAPIWQPSFQVGVPDRILGHPYFINDDFPTIAADAKVMAFGDFSKYWIRLVRDFNLIRVDERYADELASGFIGWGRFDGKQTNTDAIKLLEMQ